MAHVNGTAAHDIMARPDAALAESSNNHGIQISPERLKEVRDQLAEAFDPEMQNAEPELREQIADFHRMFFANQVGAAMPVV